MFKDELRESEVEFAVSLRRASFNVLLSHMLSDVTLDKIMCDLVLLIIVTT